MRAMSSIVRGGCAVVVAASMILTSSPAWGANWTGSADFSWSNPLNWDTNPTIPNASGAIANFGQDIGGDTTITLDGTKTVGTISFGDPTPGNSWILAPGTGGPLVLQDADNATNITLNNG